ncbi:hypothetical protein SEA_EFFIE_780 [Acinetobacter phage Effie]|nr:hypothetical protein SEA_EFFIE_40 [Acinetobacter phage Effie]QXO06693.1 hypothetical protein SEA_EFFIE_780 [Acinetobacter phage Effie]
MKIKTRYRGILITKWSGQYYVGENPENRNPLFQCNSLQDVIDFIDRHVPII